MRSCGINGPRPVPFFGTLLQLKKKVGWISFSFFRHCGRKKLGQENFMHCAIGGRGLVQDTRYSVVIDPLIGSVMFFFLFAGND